MKTTCCSILYQRGIYPPESFMPVAKYGLSILVSADEGLKTYLVQVLRQVSGASLHSFIHSFSFIHLLSIHNSIVMRALPRALLLYRVR